MINFNVQLNNDSNNIKTLHEIVEEAFSIKKPVIDTSFFYNIKKEPSKIKYTPSDKTRFTNIKKQF